ncbi:hypothetical protein [Cohnella faecalis]|uniref:Uncharacterized protein n=1 Tax=Cohnella faecalis TaxID=2315694 RepID=A0A398CMI9_9BACL|nr:hypothetical protein [Cohnella faecalis]RIE03470.1 hypothetical protein D3H35_12500 [Cohnella faecalis]
MKHRRFLTIIPITLLLLSAASYLMSDGSKSFPAATISDNGKLKAVVLTDAANNPKAMKEQKFTYTITDENGQSVSGAVVDVSLTMPVCSAASFPRG